MNKSIDTKLAKAVGKRIRFFRKSQGMTIEQLAERCEPQLNPNYLGAVERGEYNLSITGLSRIANGLDVSLADLVTISDQSSPLSEIENKLQNLLTTAKGLHSAELDYFTKLIKEYKEELKPAVITGTCESLVRKRPGKKPGRPTQE